MVLETQKDGGEAATNEVTGASAKRTLKCQSPYIVGNLGESKTLTTYNAVRCDKA